VIFALFAGVSVSQLPIAGLAAGGVKRRIGALHRIGAVPSEPV
jgi:hypothetical protein